MMSGRRRRPFQPPSVCIQYSSERLNCLARFRCGVRDSRSEPVVVLGPVDECHFRAVDHVLAGCDSPVQPEISGWPGYRFRLLRVERHRTLLQSDRMGHLPTAGACRAKAAAAFGRSRARTRIPLVFNGMVLAFQVFHREAHGKRLNVVGLRHSGAWSSPVCFFDSKPVTYSVFVSGRRSPCSVASRKYLA